MNLTKLSRVASLISMSRLDMIRVGFGDYQMGNRSSLQMSSSPLCGTEEALIPA